MHVLLNGIPLGAATGGFMFQPFASNFVVHNLGVSLDQLPIIHISGGILGQP